MHEYSVTKNIIDTVVDASGGQKITTISLVIGDLSSIIDDSVQLYFDILSAGTAAEGAKLKFTRISAELMCKACGYKFAKPRTGFTCPKCSGDGTLTDKGKEFYIESIEVENSPP